MLIVNIAPQQPSMAEPKAREWAQVPGNKPLHCWSLFWITSTNFYLSSVNMNSSVFPGCGIPHSPLFSSTGVVPGVKDNSSSCHCFAALTSPSPGDGCEICWDPAGTPSSQMVSAPHNCTWGGEGEGINGLPFPPSDLQWEELRLLHATRTAVPVLNFFWELYMSSLLQWGCLGRIFNSLKALCSVSAYNVVNRIIKNLAFCILKLRYSTTHYFFFVSDFALLRQNPWDTRQMWESLESFEQKQQVWGYWWKSEQGEDAYLWGQALVTAYRSSAPQRILPSLQPSFSDSLNIHFQLKLLHSWATIGSSSSSSPH